MGKKDEEFLIKYKGEVIKNNLNMTEVSYWVVEDYLNRKNNTQSFSEFRDSFKNVQRAIGGNTQFLLEEMYIGDEINKGSDGKKRRKDYFVKVRPFLIHQYNNEITTFGVYTQWKNEDSNSNFAKFVTEIKELGYIIEVENIYNYENNKIDKDELINLKEDGIIMDMQNLNSIIQYINTKGFIYSKEDLANFYLSLKAKPFVILAGVSGTGKSKLVRLFAEAINAKFKSIPVKPDWNDSTELLGYKNIKDEFVAGELYKVIDEAKDNSDTPYFVCLDEMNLARVEYYLSEYLSVIESRKFDDSKIVTDELFSKTYFDNIKERNITIPDNLYIVGTVNMDDTTFSFSRKVLDRANTIEFSKVDLLNLPLVKKAEQLETIGLNNDAIKSSFLTLQEAIEINPEFVKDINQKIVTIYNYLEPHSKHFGYRVRDEIVFYMLENKQADLLSEEDAFDYQIMQKILPTIIGSDIYIKEILINLFELCTDYKFENKDNYLQEAEKVVVEINAKIREGKHPRSAKKILLMLKGYRDGFVSFWQ